MAWACLRFIWQDVGLVSCMQDELKLFYSCFNPPMVPKAKGMVVLNISRQKVHLVPLRFRY